MLLLVPLLFFLVLVLSAIGLHSKEASPFGDFVNQACLLGPTVFPIAFSAILGWCLKTYERYKSERGVKLGELERVIGSQKVFSFLKLAFTFKKLDRLCIVLGILWALSPLGGQGILCMLSMRQVDDISTEKLFYFDLYDPSLFQDAIMSRSFYSRVNRLYIASLLAPNEVKKGPTDLWGDVKIPSLNSLDFDHQDDDGVIVGETPTYLSLLGIPVGSTAYKNATKYTFIFNTNAFTAQCQGPRIVNKSDTPFPRDGSKFVLETQPPDPESGEGTERNISLITFPLGITGPAALVHNWTITPNCLLAKVECSYGHCGVSRIKMLVESDVQSIQDMLNTTTWDVIAKELPQAENDGRKRSQTELYLNDPESTGYLTALSDSFGNLEDIPPVEFSRGFTTILNTYHQATIRVTILRRFTEFPAPPWQVAVTTSHVLSPKMYQRHWEWVISALIASFAMLGVAIAGILLERRVISPDIYGYVSSMTRDNPYFPLPPTGCTLEGTKRAVLLNDVFVRFEDVSPNKKIGHLAFTMAGYKTLKEQSIDCRLRRTKIYSGCS
ncbi:hypothetical protein CPB86DRAFT_603428 [Serendipita vermifera]|nr:hypothetical protein CPB86DRAFT_603428 [Serendipita vermifera]